MADHLRAELSQAALRRAWFTRAPDPGLVHHAASGSPYTRAEYRALFEDAGIQGSLRRARPCFANAPLASFWGKLTPEGLYRHHVKTRAQARTTILADLAGFYNRQRRPSTLAYQSPQPCEPAFWTN